VFVAAAATICLALASLPFIPADTTGKSAGRFSVRDLRASLLDLRLIAFCVICTLFFFQMGQWGSTLSVFSVDRVKLTTEQYGLLMSVAGLLIVIFQYPVSRSVGWMGARTALAFGSLLYAVGFLSLGWAGSFWAVLISIVVMVPGEMLFIPTSYEVIVQISRPGDRAKNLGLLGLFATLGQSLGPLFGGALLDKFKSQPLFVWGPVAVPGAIATIGFLLWRGYASKSVGKAIVKTEQATKDHIN
jgi:MFS family permease